MLMFAIKQKMWTCTAAQRGQKYQSLVEAEKQTCRETFHTHQDSVISTFSIFLFFFKHNFGFKQLLKGNSAKISFVPFHSVSQWCSRSVSHYKSSAAFSFTAVNFSPSPQKPTLTLSQAMACLARLTAVKPSFVKKQQNICETWQVYTHNQQNVQTPSKLFFSMLFDIFSLSYIFILSFILIHSHNSVHLAGVSTWKHAFITKCYLKDITLLSLRSVGQEPA